MSVRQSQQHWLQAILKVARHYRLQVSVEALRNELQWTPEGQSADQPIRLLAKRAGMNARFSPVNPDLLLQRRLPVVAELHDGAVLVLIAQTKGDGYRVMDGAEPDAEYVISEDELLTRVARLAVFRPLNDVPDARVDDYIKPYKANWFWSIIFRDWRRYGDVMLASLMANILALSGIILSLQVYDRVVPAQSMPTLFVLFFGVLIAIGFEFMFRVLRLNISDRVGKQADLVLSDTVFGRALRIRNEARPVSTGTFISQLRELEQIRELLSSTTVIAIADLPFFVLFLGVLWFIASPLIMLVALFAIPLIILPGLLMQKPLAKLSKQSMRESSLRNSLLIEAVQGIDDIKLMRAEPRFQGQWNHANDLVSNVNIKQRFLTHVLTAWSQEVQTLVYALVLVVGCVLVIEGEITTGVLVASSILTSRMIAPLGQLSGVFSRWQQAKVAREGLDSLMALPTDHAPDQQLMHKPHWRGEFELAGVRFTYPGENNRPVLGIERLKIQPNERIAVLGRMGSGKSTLIQLLSGLMTPQEGSIQLDGMSLPIIDPADIRRDVGVLSQTATLFHGTIRDNISMGAPHASDQALIDALTLAGAERLLQSAPQGLDTMILEGGRGLSGGQRQAILLARTLVRDPSILLLDEPTASYDDPSERAVIERLRPWLNGRTFLVATHRPAILALVDRVIVIDSGRVVLDGSKDKVLEALTK